MSPTHPVLRASTKQGCSAHSNKERLSPRGDKGAPQESELWQPRSAAVSEKHVRQFLTPSMFRGPALRRPATATTQAGYGDGRDDAGQPWRVHPTTGQVPPASVR